MGAPDPMKDVIDSRKQLRQRLAARPTEDVVGIVDPSGRGSVRLRGDELWTVQFRFTAWRCGQGPIEKGPLAVQRAVADGDDRELDGRVQPGSVLRIRARVLVDAAPGGAHAYLEDVVREDADPELTALAQEQRKPVTLEDPQLGTFALDRRLNWYTGSAVWRDRPVSLYLEAATPGEAEAALRTAHALWGNMDAWTARIEDHAAAELLALKNESWLDEDEPEVSAEEFKQRMELKSITVSPDGAFEFMHNDGDLFWGHAIQVRGSLSAGPTSADIPG